MGSLAGMLRESGYRVTGSDARIYPPMSDFLRSAGIEVMEGFDAAHLRPEPDLVVVGNAVSRGNVEVESTLDQRLPFASLPEILRDFYLRPPTTPIVVTGTHGKTTTTAMIAHLLSQGGLDPSYLIAGITLDFPKPYHLGTGAHFVVEGDEYDSAFFAKQAKFLSYLPQLLVINNIEFDHADIYPDLEHIETSFRQLINVVPGSGLVVANHDDPVVRGLLPGSLAAVQTFGLSPSAEWSASDIEPRGRRVSFTVSRHASELGRFELALSGRHNVRNALGAIAIASHVGLEPGILVDALSTFKGIERRQQVIAEAAGIILIDDFAHHPTAVDETLAGLRLAYPDARMWAVFEPASASNARRIFEERYVSALGRADRVTLAAVPRPERSGDEEPFSSQRVATALKANGTMAAFVPDIDDLAQLLEQDMKEGDLVVFMSNGGFGGIQRTACGILEARAATGGSRR